MLNLAGTILALRHSSADIERLFSLLKLIKSVKRLNLTEDKLESLLLLKLSDLNIQEPQYRNKISNKQSKMKQEHAENKKESRSKIADVQKFNNCSVK